MKFSKYPKIIGNAKDADYYLTKHSVAFLATNKYFITEKLDGTNFAIYYDVNTGNVKFAKRSGWLDPREKFFGYKEFFTSAWVEKFLFQMKDIILYVREDEMGFLKNFEDLIISHIIFRGEYFGGKIQKRIDYGDKQFNLFDVEVVYISNEEKEFFTYIPFEVLVEKVPKDLLVPVLGVEEDILQALKFDVKELKSARSPVGVIAEGVVIKPSPGIFVNNKWVMFKLKNEKFKEKKQKKQKKEPTVQEKVFASLISDFINENRFLSVVSKEGEFETISQLGKFIKVMSKDIIEDIVKEEWFLKASKDEQKKIFKEISRQAAAFLKQKLSM